MIDTTISHYRIIEQLGEGGMGVVYLAEDTRLGRRVALKVLHTSTKAYRTRFLQEVCAVSRLNHPNIPAVFEYGETPTGQAYVVMELSKGKSLDERLKQGSLPLPEAIRIISSVAEALGEAHRQGVVHRDIKPSNILITEHGQAQVTDFGLMKATKRLYLTGEPTPGTLPLTHTHSDAFAGTPLYCSPEQATGSAVDPRSDLFALGLVLYECLTGQSAFSAPSWNELREQVLHFTPPAPSKINDRILPELDRINMKAIEKKLEYRYQSAGELGEDLRAVLPMITDEGYHHGQPTHPAPLAPIKANSRTPGDLRSEFDDLLAKMQTPRSRRAMKVAFEASSAELGRAAVKRARKKR